MKFWEEQLRISGDKTFGEMTFGRLDRKPLGLSDTSASDESSMYPEFKGQFVQDNYGWYETGLPWRGHHPVLPNNKEGSLHRLCSLNK